MSVSGNGVVAGAVSGLSEDFVRLMLRMSTDAEFAAHLQSILDATEAHKHALGQLDLGMQAKDALERAAGLEKAAKARLDEINTELAAMRERAEVESQRLLQHGEERFQTMVADAKAKAEAMLVEAEAKLSRAAGREDAVKAAVEAAALVTEKAEAFMKEAEVKMAEAMAEKQKNVVESRRLATLAERLNDLFKGDET